MLLKRLNEVNDINIYSVLDRERFRTYGRVVEGYDFSELISYMEKSTEIPAEGNIYVPSVPEMEKLPAASAISSQLYGGMDIEIGYCNGRNSTLNGFEYHKGSEINIAVTDFMLCLGHVWDIDENHYNAEDAEIFYVPKNTAIEMYATTLHLSPCRTCDEGFKGIVVLPRGTNTAFDRTEPVEDEGRLLLYKNKWVIAHPEREPLIKQGAYAGVRGENRKLKY